LRGSVNHELSGFGVAPAPDPAPVPGTPPNRLPPVPQALAAGLFLPPFFLGPPEEEDAPDPDAEDDDPAVEEDPPALLPDVDDAPALPEVSFSV